MTEAQKRAKAKYRAKRRQITLAFYPPEYELYVKLREAGARKIKEILREVLR